MIPNYCEYINTYIRGKGRATSPMPGEHHFVSAYLVPKLYSINGNVPDYINPDGTKSILGDIVYYKNGKHHFGIEVKLGTVRLTKREFNEWIVRDDLDRWPNLFVGVGCTGLGLAPWRDFRTAYIASVQKKMSTWVPKKIEKGYGPMKQVDELACHLPDEAWFPWSANDVEIAANEEKFVDALRSGIQG